MEPVLSVVIPVYNGEASIKKCIESLLNQSFNDYEIIIIDDGSQDNSLNICLKYASLYFNIIVYHIKNGGVSNARNQGIKLAKGKYIMFVDCDDYLEANMFETYVNTIKQHDVDVVIGGLTAHLKNGSIVNKVSKVLGRYDTSIWNVISGNNDIFGYAASKVYKLDIIKDNNILFNINMKSQEDLDFALSVYQYCNSFMLIDYCGYHYDYVENKRVVPYIDLIKNQLKIYRLANKKVTLSKENISSLEDRICSLIYGYLYSCNTYIQIKEVINLINQINELETFIEATDMLQQRFLVRCCKQEKYSVVYMYFKVRKTLGKIKHKIRGE